MLSTLASMLIRRPIRPACMHAWRQPFACIQTLCVTLLFVCIANPNNAAQADGLIDPLTPLYTDSDLATTGQKSFTTHAVRGGMAWVHAVTAIENTATPTLQVVDTEPNHPPTPLRPARTSPPLREGSGEGDFGPGVSTNAAQPKPQTPPPGLLLKGEESETKTSGAALFSNASIHRLAAVPVEQNTGLHSRTEVFERLNNPFVIRDSPFAVFEILVPTNQPFPDNGHQSQTLTAHSIQLDIAPDAAPGPHTIQVAIGNDTYNWTIVVHDAALPDGWQQTMGFTNWLHVANVQKFHQTGWFDDAYFDVLSKYATLMAHIGQNTIPVPTNDLFDLVDGQPVLNTERATRWVQRFQNVGMHNLELMHLAKRPDGQWTAEHLLVWLTGHRADSPEGQTDLDRMCEQLATWLPTLGLHATNQRSQVLIHVADEPTETNAAAYRDVANRIKIHLPQAQIFDATLCRDLTGAIDTWCPQAHRWTLNQDFFDVRQALGDGVWFYTCLEPGGPWLNRLLDQERTRIPLLHWATFRFGLQGYLHWALNHWMADPYETSALKHPYDRNPRNWLPAGDTHLIYPPSKAMLEGGFNAPLSSVRAEAHRQGMQDHALLSLLATTQPRLAMQLANQLVGQMDDYQAGVDSYRRVQANLYNALAHPAAP